MLGIIIQARTGSTRLPNKMVLPFYQDSGVLELIVNKIKRSINEYPIVIATTTNPNDDEIVEVANKCFVSYFRGSENNVLSRFIECSNKNNFNKIIRICADNPFIDIEGLKQLINEFDKSDVDYCSYKTSKGIPSILTHFGFWCEAVTLSALETTSKLTNDSLYLEHVTNFIYTNPNLFKLSFLPIVEKVEQREDVRMTLDTEQDFNLLKTIYSKCIEENIHTIEDIISFVSGNKEWVYLMKQQIDANTK